MIDPTNQRTTAFISLHEILFLIAKAKDWTPQVAAQSLAQTIRNDSNWQRLQMVSYDPASGIFPAYGALKTGALSALDRLARTGEWDDPDDIPSRIDQSQFCKLQKPSHSYDLAFSYLEFQPDLYTKPETDGIQFTRTSAISLYPCAYKNHVRPIRKLQTRPDS